MFVATVYMTLGRGAIAEPFDDSRLAAIGMALHTVDAHAPDLMSVFLDGSLPMAVVYENDYLYDAINHEISPDYKVVMMYQIQTSSRTTPWSPGMPPAISWSARSPRPA
jgi:hypothetical protein